MVPHLRQGRPGGLVLLARDFMIGPLTNRGHPWVPTVDVRREEIIFGMDPRHEDCSIFGVAVDPKLAKKLKLEAYLVADQLFACGDNRFSASF
ncbi:hypothetical protein [Mycolicibacterium moriokaense]|uniref:hypothetical protein n=1 Tax=Mycolicibacterium moriokaense TaxID=39691 RepID=UPI0011B82732|nr:hypothetical protein [Mycolicibacterium moriokaense]